MRGAGFSYFDHGFLLQQMNRQNFAALGILYGSNLVGACVAAGQYTSAEVMGLYIVPEFQRKGLGTRLLQQTKQALASTGVTDLTMRVMSDSESRCAWCSGSVRNWWNTRACSPRCRFKRGMAIALLDGFAVYAFVTLWSCCRGNFASAEATKGLSDRPLETFGAHSCLLVFNRKFLVGVLFVFPINTTI